MSLLSTPIEKALKINARIIPALKRLGISTIRDLLFHFPSRYEDFSNVKHIADIIAEERVTIEGKITELKNFRTARKRMHIIDTTIEDESGATRALWFNQPFLLRTLKTGTYIRLSGKTSKGAGGITFQNPAYERIPSLTRKEDTRGVHTGGLVPVYPETQGITSRWIRFLMHAYIDTKKDLLDPLPQEVIARYQLIPLQDAIANIHFPQVSREADEAKKRFAFEELLLLQLRSLRERARIMSRRAPAILLDIPLIQEFVKQLPFSLTDAQRRSLWEILRDLEKPRPMNRLLLGDVGSGKTVVATAAALLVARRGYRALFMAPTEILAEQHHDTLRKLLYPFGITIGLLTGSQKKILPNAQIIVGTHALIQKKIQFDNLGLVVIDEQHRFGVEQRAHLQKKHGEQLLPHFLSMSATPIPRTLALTIYGDLDLSIIDEIPKSRREIITKIVEPKNRRDAYTFIEREIHSGRQAFVICPKIEPKSEGDRITNSPPQFLLQKEVKTVKEEYKKLSEQIFPHLRLAMLHGKLKPKEKNKIMEEFKNGIYDILVSTSVIEVGIDVQNATIMLIEGAERFGLAQLYQFRGRVGRGTHQSYCFLFSTEDSLPYAMPVQAWRIQEPDTAQDSGETPKGITKRLRAIIEAKNGFELAEKDLEIRGPGDLFGARQSGIPDLALANITNAQMVREVRQAAKDIIQKSPDLRQFPLLREKLNEFEQSIHLE